MARYVGHQPLNRYSRSNLPAKGFEPLTKYSRSNPLTNCAILGPMTTEYVEYFNTLVGVVETYGGSYGNEPGLIKAQVIAQGVVTKDLGSPDPAKLEKALAVCREEYLSCMILQGSDNTRFYHQLKIDLASSMTMKKDKFLKTMVETQCLLND
jgi:hypothetical protein